MFTLAEREALVQASIASKSNVSVVAITGLTADYAQAHEVDTIIRGLRNAQDFSYEEPIAQMNATLSGVETIFMPTKPQNMMLSSSMIKEVAKAGYVKITDSKDAEYYYQRVKTSDSEEYAKLMELAEDINSKYSEMDMYEKVQANEQFYSLYSKLTNEAKWQKVENMEIKQPESTEQSNGTGDKYIVFLKKIAKSGDTTLDAQFLQEYYDYEPNAVIERVETQEITKLPITYDSIALIVILALVVIALVVIFIRMKKLNKKNEEK